MKKYLNGKYIEMTETEITELYLRSKQEHAEYWHNTDYGEAINSEIRKKYTQSEEFAILRQKNEKPDEYNEYFDYCESCKAYVKEQKQKYGGEAL